MLSSTEFYSYHNLQGSQTLERKTSRNFKFYSYHNLQGSQTIHRRKLEVCCGQAFL